jgi:hypothetical protein
MFDGKLEKTEGEQAIEKHEMEFLERLLFTINLFAFYFFLLK